MKPGRDQLGQEGFTLLEILLVMGLLSAFMVFLVQMLSSGLSIFDRGETGQDLADRAQTAAAVGEELVESLLGPERDELDNAMPDARLVVQRVALGLDETATTTTFALRSHVRLSTADETRLLRRSLQARAEATARTRSEEDVALRLEDLVLEAPRLQRGEMLLLPWPSDSRGEFLELRRGLFAPEQRIALARDRDVALFEAVKLGSEELPRDVVLAQTEVVLTGLLHVELELWSQYTKSFDSPPPDGPELGWDSARAGWFLDGQGKPVGFSLDLGPASLTRPSDDVFPRWLRLTLVVGRPQPETVLLGTLSADDSSVRVARGSNLPEEGMAKIGAEWIAFQRDEDQLHSLRRGQRNTKAAGHGSGDGVRIGKTVVLTLRLRHGRDSWNG